MTEKAVVTIVQKTLSKALENKLAVINGKANTDFGVPHATEYILPRIDTTSTWPILPQVPVGMLGNERIGNVITPKVLKVRGTVYFNWDGSIPALASSRYLDVRMMVVTNKQQKYYPDLAANPSSVYTNTLLWNGQAGEPMAYEGCQLYYNTVPINRRGWNVLEDKLIHLRKGLGAGGGSTEVFGSSTRSANFEFVLTQKDLPATFKYNEVGDGYPTNYAPVMYIGFADATGAMDISDINSDKVLAIEYTSQLIYEDA